MTGVYWLHPLSQHHDDVPASVNEVNDGADVDDDGDDDYWVWQEFLPHCGLCKKTQVDF